jgi:hypothetical protein
VFRGSAGTALPLFIHAIDFRTGLPHRSVLPLGDSFALRRLSGSLLGVLLSRHVASDCHDFASNRFCNDISASNWALVRYASIRRFRNAGSQRPPVRDRRLVVTSGLHRNSAYLCRRAALAKRAEASGMVDKHPVLAQSCRTRSVLSVTCLAPIRSACSVYPHFRFWHTKSNPLRGRFASSVCPHIGHAFEV